ncbi:hypothetical protein [Pseudomonas fulva]|uniref:hypothetical protein n=1 Tax=Pseudomonas fulva TaxID=47880 RepID=UPI0018AB6A0A|nr:hypothetical protein [Pseudomonas fulva]MBF8775927.1 hypothetical protein [Pseudomonas fulva]
MTAIKQTLTIDGNDKSERLSFGEMDEALAHDASDGEERLGSRVYFDYEVYTLYSAGHLKIQRRLIEAFDDDMKVATADEIQVWLDTANVSLNQACGLDLEVDGVSLRLNRSTPDQRVHLLLSGEQTPAGLADNADGTLRVDASASADARFETTAIDHLFIYGTPQFQNRVYAQLALLSGYPELKQALDAARQRYADVPDIVLMQCHAGPAQLGPGFDLSRVIPARYAHLLPGAYTAVLYDPYQAKGLDGLTALARLLQDAYEALAPSVLVPARGIDV